MDITIIDKLKKISKCAENSCSGSDKYNIFEVLGVEYKEVIMCRFIGDLLDCKGKHGLDTEPLRLFIRDVLHDESVGDDLEKSAVKLEDITENGRRVDIAIYLNSRIYPIEVKIWADDQSKQLEDYYEYYFGKSKDGKIYYLTPNGRSPSDKSKGGLNGEKDGQIVCISFSEDIKNWLDEVQNIKGATKNIKFVIRNFMEVIKKMGNESNELNEIKKMLELDNDEMYDSEAIEGAILLLKHRDEIWNTIRKNYIRSILDCGGKFKLCECDANFESVSHIVLSVYKIGESVPCAWICVDTNLYIVTRKKDINGDCDRGWESYNDQFQWKYINDGNKHIPLKTPTPLKNDLKIDLMYYL